MKPSFVALAAGLLTGVRIASAFQPIAAQQSSFGASLYATIDIDENAPRDVASMEEWATNCGVQKAEGFQLISGDGGQDFSVTTARDLPAGSPVLFVPSQIMILSSNMQEYGEQLAPAEDLLVQAGLGDQIPLFRLFVKILVEYEKGDQSPYFPWLNSLPRRYNNGASMTYACFDCLPPYVAWLSKQERSTFKQFHKVLHHIPFFDGITIFDRHLVKFAYNVAVTRSFDSMNGEVLIAPMADMFNHGAETEVEINFDEEGNCIVYTARDVPAGSPLRVSLGDSTNPSPLFARHGFLDESSPGTFCKIMHLQREMRELGLEFSDLLFYNNGDISGEVWDLMLYSVLATDPNLQQGFYQACMSGDTETKNSYHQQYFPYSLEALQKHVDKTLKVLGTLSARANSYDRSTHPRIPVILKHNKFVKSTFLRVKAHLDAMALECDSER